MLHLKSKRKNNGQRPPQRACFKYLIFAVVAPADAAGLAEVLRLLVGGRAQ